jgi:hypothetical protein
VSSTKAASGGAVVGVLLAIAIIIGGAMCDWYDGKQTPTPAEDCDSEDWKNYEDECDRWSPSPGRSQRPVVIKPQKTRK